MLHFAITYFYMILFYFYQHLHYFFSFKMLNTENFIEDSCIDILYVDMHIQYINSRIDLYKVLELPSPAFSEHAAFELENQTEIALHYWIV